VDACGIGAAGGDRLRRWSWRRGLIGAAGVNPLTAYVEMLRGALGSRLAVTEMLTRAVPLMLTGLAAAVAFRARLWNIGGEGQFYVGALAVAWVGHSMISGLPPALGIAVLMVVGMAAGALAAGGTGLPAAAVRGG
jgi:ABC-type uncharacterized transport system permease subunit